MHQYILETERLILRPLTVNERFERAIYLMEQRNIAAVWSAGRCVVSR